MSQKIRLNLGSLIGHLCSTRFRGIVKPDDLKEAESVARVVGKTVVGPEDLNRVQDLVSRAYATACYLASEYRGVCERIDEEYDRTLAQCARVVRKKLRAAASETEVRQHVWRKKVYIQAARQRREAREVLGIMEALRSGADRRLRALEAMGNNLRADLRVEQGGT
jgi:hypothetical protein